MISGDEVCDLCVTNLNSGGLAVLEEHIAVHKGLPCGVADLLVSLLCLSAGACSNFVDRCEGSHLGGEILIRDTCTVDLTYVLRPAEKIHQVVHRGDEVQEGKRDDYGDSYSELVAHLL